MRLLKIVVASLAVLLPFAWYAQRWAFTEISMLYRRPPLVASNETLYDVDEVEIRAIEGLPIGRVGFPGTKPILIESTPLELPAEHPLRIRGGVLVLELIVGTNGRIARFRPLSGNLTAGTRDAVVDCLRAWRYQPATYEGTPWPVAWNVTLRFWPPGSPGRLR